jgi:hypothetical protein
MVHLRLGEAREAQEALIQGWLYVILIIEDEEVTSGKLLAERGGPIEGDGEEGEGAYVWSGDGQVGHIHSVNSLDAIEVEANAEGVQGLNWIDVEDISQAPVLPRLEVGIHTVLVPAGDEVFNERREGELSPHLNGETTTREVFVERKLRIVDRT